MRKRRDFLLAGVISAVVGVPAWGFEVDSALLRYRSWLAQFESDLARLSKNLNESADLSAEQIAIVCTRSVAPDSRAAAMVKEWLTDIADQRRSGHGANRYAGVGAIAMLLLKDSVPAGYGGQFQEAPESHFPSNRFSVWYMHITGPEALQAYFDDKAQFPSYKLPPNGMLKRHAYPFLLFEDTGSALRLAGIGSEWMGAAVYLARRQYS